MSELKIVKFITVRPLNQFYTTQLNCAVSGFRGCAAQCLPCSPSHLRQATQPQWWAQANQPRQTPHKELGFLLMSHGPHMLPTHVVLRCLLIPIYHLLSILLLHMKWISELT